MRWYGPDGKPKAKTCTTKPKAEAEQKAILARLDKGTYRDPSAAKAAFSIVAEEWFASLRKQGRRTKNDYRELLDLYVLPRWQEWQVGAIQWADVSEWINDLCEQPGASGRKLSPGRIAKTYYVFSGVMKHAVKTLRIASSPATAHDLPRAHDDNEAVYLTHAQVQALAAAAGPYLLLLLVMAYTGIRWGEAIAVTVGRLDLRRNRLRITQAYSDVNGHLELGPVKNHEKREVPLPGFLMEGLATLAKLRVPEDLLFTAPRGGTLRYPNFRRRYFDKAVEAAGLGALGITPHKLRHTAASLAIAAGANVKEVQAMLGHKSAVMTLDLYGHLWPDRLDDVAVALERQRSVELGVEDIGNEIQALAEGVGGTGHHSGAGAVLQQLAVLRKRIDAMEAALAA
ncbi:tyrosine-type recombinase/integrase [Streptomyces sp. NPDC049555]|uniref:tyrosine-type recombinase/integrase n=1 Tax=Streptomyces sp. NPDC049555 TaxID=3154930 RepID=UPI00343ABC38